MYPGFERSQSESCVESSQWGWLLQRGGNSLLRVVRGICENSGIKPTLDTVRTLYNNAMNPGFYKFVIKENFPLLMKELSETMGHKRLARRCATGCLCAGKFLETTGELASVLD